MTEVGPGADVRRLGLLLRDALEGSPPGRTWRLVSAPLPTTHLDDFIALSLLPWWCRPPFAELMRSGRSPADALRILLRQQNHEALRAEAEVRAEASAALASAAAGGI